MIETLQLSSLPFMQFIASFRNPFVNPLFFVLNFVDSKEFVFLLVSVVWMAVNQKWGLRVFFLVCINFLINSAIKNIFELQRPFVQDPALFLLQKDGYSFPSGAAQSAAIYFGLLMFYIKKRWSYTLGAILFTLLSFSRIYLGLHYPIDIIAGWIVGGLIFTAFYFFHKKVEKHLTVYPIILAMIGILLISPYRIVTIYCYIILGIALGIIIQNYFGLICPETKKFWQKVYRSIFCILGVFVFSYLFDQTSLYLFSFLVGLWIPLNGFLLSWRSIHAKN